jgi:hypothetical protein
MSVYDKLKELNITLPPVAVPAAAYVPFVQTGNLVFLSRPHRPPGRQALGGQLGRDMTTDEGKLAARAIAIDLMGTLQPPRGRGRPEQGDAHRQGDEPGQQHRHYTEQHLVTNGCSELLGEVFGERGAHARSAFGVAQIPLGACVEIELIAEIG